MILVLGLTVVLTMCKKTATLKLSARPDGRWWERVPLQSEGMLMSSRRFIFSEWHLRAQSVPYLLTGCLFVCFVPDLVPDQTPHLPPYPHPHPHTHSPNHHLRFPTPSPVCSLLQQLVHETKRITSKQASKHRNQKRWIKRNTLKRPMGTKQSDDPLSISIEDVISIDLAFCRICLIRDSC